MARWSPSKGRLRDSGWALLMPEAPDSLPQQPVQTPLANMMRWITSEFLEGSGLAMKLNVRLP